MSSASVSSLQFLSFIVSILAWNVPLITPIFSRRSLVFPILLLSTISFHSSFKKAFLSFLAVLWNSAFSWVYISLTSLLFPFFLPQLFLKPPQTTTLPSCVFFPHSPLWEGVGYCLLYHVMKLHPQFFRHSVYQTQSFESTCRPHRIIRKDLI